MQSQRTILSLIALTIILLAAGCLNPDKEELSSAPSAIAQQEAARAGGPVQLLSSSVETKTNFEKGEFEEISEVLNTIATGRKTLNLIEQYDIDVQFEASSGSRFNPNTNQIVIDTKHELLSAALILIHEVTHARFLHDGSAADVKANGRQEFVQKKVAEEMEAVVSAIEAKMELERAGINVSELSCTLENPYRQAYWAATSVAQNDDPDVDDKTLESVGRAAGRASVLQFLLNGKAVTSNTKQTYPFYWGAEWDKQNEAS